MSEPQNSLLPPPEEIAEFIRLERESFPPPTGLEQQIFGRVLGTVGLPLGDLGIPHAPAAPEPPGGEGATAPPPTDVGEVVEAAGSVLRTGRPLLRTVVAFVVGSGVGAGVQRALDPPTHDRAPVVSRQSPLPPPSPVAAPAPPAPAPEPAAPVAPRPPGGPAKTQHGPPPEMRERDRDLAAERGLIEQARTALSRGNGEMAASALERHARTFPRGALEEERESLRVQALVASDRQEEARASGARFHRRFPRSIFAPVVDEALRSIP